MIGPDGREIDISDGFEVIEGENLYDRVIRAYSGDRSELVSELGLAVDSTGYDSLITDFSSKATAYLSDIAEAKKQASIAAVCLAQVKSAEKFISANATLRADVVSYNRDSGLDAKLASVAEKMASCGKDIEAAKLHFGSLETIATNNRLPNELVTRLRAVRDEFLTQLFVRRVALSRECDKLRLSQAKQALLFEATQTYNGLVSEQYQQVNEKKQVLLDKLDEIVRALLMERRKRFCADVPTLSKALVESSIGLSSDNNVAKLDVKSVNLSIDVEDYPERFPNSICVKGAKNKIPRSKFSNGCELSDPDSVKALLDCII